MVTRGAADGYGWKGRAGSDEIEGLAFLEFDDGFFPMVGAAGVGAARRLLAVVVGGVHRRLFLSKVLDGLFDLDLVGLALDLEGRIRCFSPEAAWPFR
jgi:hypothetical protein